MPKVVVLVPGIMGSVLKLGQEVIWPGPPTSLFWSYSEERMSKLLESDLKPTDCIRSYALPQYKALIDQFNAWQFTEESGTLWIAAYDWRKSNSESAQTLAAVLKAVVAERGADVHISLVAHSMGGLVARYFLESGEHDATPEWNAVRDLITMATPHRGAPVALPVVAGLEKRLFLSADQVKQLCDDTRYPGAYELLPQAGEPVAWDAGVQGDIKLVDFYDVQVAAQLGLNQANLQAAASFHERLNNGSRPAHTNYFCFAGTRETTAPYVRLVARLGNLLHPDKVNQENTGDGTVPIWSSTLPKTRFLYVPGEHGVIYKGAKLQQHLGALLGIWGLLDRGAPTELSVEPPVVEPSSHLRLNLNFGLNVTELTGRLILERMQLTQTGEISSFRGVQEHPVDYKGPEIDSFQLKIQAPEDIGHYRVAYYDSGVAEPSASTELIVQGVAI